MEASELQKKAVEFVKKWEKKRGVNPTKKDIFVHFTEELGELAAQYVNETDRSGKYDLAEIEDALGDIFMMLCRLAEFHEVDIEETVNGIIARETPLLDEEQ